MLVTSIQDACKELVPHMYDGSIKYCKIMTYNIWVPLCATSSLFTANVKDLLGTLRQYNVPTKILVGAYDVDACEDRCATISKDYPNVKIKIKEEFHAKGIVLSNRVALIGSMNLTDSKYMEFGIVTKLTVEELKQFNEIFDKLWK